MSAVTLSLANLGELSNGAAGVVIDAAIKAVIRDTEDRGLEDKKPRKVTIIVTMNKVDDDTITSEVEAKATLPPYRTKKTAGTVKYRGKDPTVEFQPNARERPDQETFPFPKEKAE